MVHGIEDLAVHGFLELLEVNYEAGAGINLSLDRHFEDVVVAVPIWVIALAENAPVLLRGEVRVVVVVRGSEFSFASEVEQGFVLPFAYVKVLIVRESADRAHRQMRAR